MDSILLPILGTKFIQSKLSQILIILTVNILQAHITTIACTLLSINPYIDFATGVVIPVAISTNIHLLYMPVNKYTREFTVLTRYLITNYSFDNYRRWKRWIILLGCCYACIILWRIRITNELLIMYIIQYAITYLIIDTLEGQGLWEYIHNWRTTPVIRKNVGDSKLIDSYMSPTTLRESIIIDQRRR